MYVVVVKGGSAVKAEIEKPEKVNSILARLGADINMPCSGQGRCGKCKVKAEGQLSEVTQQELRFLTPEELAGGIRLACCAEVTGDAVLTVSETEGTSVLLRGSAVNVAADPGESGLGLAVDIGTTTIAAYLYDLANGRLLAQGGMENPQEVCGADVISRIGRSMAGERERLSMLVADAISELAGCVLKDSGLRNMTIAKGVCVGNTAMLYLLSARDPSSIAAAPFISDTLFGENVSAASLGFRHFADGGQIYLGRSISAYIGADITAAILSSGVCEPSRKSFLVDIGTNGEMALFNGEELVCCSTAAGPAFEGVGISCGCTAKDGAISHARAREGKIECNVMGDKEPMGICGTGLIDAAAAMLELGLIDETGRIDEETAVDLGCYGSTAGGAIRLSDGVALTQGDIRQLQLAKAAVRAGIETLLHEGNVRAEELDVFYIAGGFGSYIDIGSAIKIGILPAECETAAKAVGNAAGAGASVMLLSSREREKAEKLAAGARTVELSTSAFFMDKYIDCMCFE